MNIGIDAIGSRGSYETESLYSALVKRSGAVSPAARAVARVAPVTIPPTACGRTMLRVVRHFAAPSARLASRIELGTRARTSWVARAIIGTIRIASAKLAF